MTYREVARKLRKLGCQELQRHGGGSHRRWQGQGPRQRATLPDWGKNDLRLGTLRAAIDQLGLDWDEFQRA